MDSDLAARPKPTAGPSRLFVPLLSPPWYFLLTCVVTPGPHWPVTASDVGPGLSIAERYLSLPYIRHTLYVVVFASPMYQ
jgi:hypothetical protein